MDLLVTILLYMLIVICLLAVTFGSYELGQIVMDIIDYSDWLIADDNICDMLELILSDLDKYRSCISYSSYCLHIRIDVEEGYYTHISLYYEGRLVIISPEEIKFPKSREKTLKKLITKAINEIENSENSEKLTRVKNSLSSALNPTNNQHKTPEVLDIKG